MPFRQPELPESAVERRRAHIVFFQNFIKRYEILRSFFRRSSEPHTALFRRRNAFGLPLTNGRALIFRDKRQELQYKVADEGSEQILMVSCIKQRHIYDHHVNAFVFRYDAPLVLDFLVVSSKAVYALYKKRVTRSKTLDEPLVVRSIEVLTGLLVNKYVCAIYCK